MKNQKRKFLYSIVLSIIIQLCCAVFALSQDELTGKWAGTFMEQFDVSLHFEKGEDQNYSGRITMYSAGQLLQDDELSMINLSENTLSFFIEAKETHYEGELLVDTRSLSGKFIFPDGTLHPMLVMKADEANNDKEKHGNGKQASIYSLSFSADEAREDLLFLHAKLEELHPQLYYYTDKEIFDKLFENALNDVRLKVTGSNFFLIVSTLLEKINCSHTGIHFNHEQLADLKDQGNYLPIKTYFSQKNAYCTGFYGKTVPAIPLGSSILSINDIPVPLMIETLLYAIPSEGGVITGKYYELNKRFYYYYNVLDNSNEYAIDFIPPGGKIKQSISIPSCNLRDIEYSEYEKANMLPFELSFIEEDDAALLIFRTFAIRDIDSFLLDIDSIFVMLQEKEMNHLILDLRGNSGGHPIFAAILFSYLSKNEFTYFREVPGLDEFTPLYEPMQENDNAFDGDCLVLVDGGCLSTTGHIISLLRYYSKFAFVGEEPGSNYFCNDNGQLITLPNSGFEVYIPRTSFETAVEGFSRKANFDVEYEITYDVEDIISGRDEAKEKALEVTGTNN